VCPMCGRHVPESVFDPSCFLDDIFGVKVSGLGRGKGFVVTARYSIEDPRILGLIKDRCHRILDLLDDKDYVSPGELAALRALLESWVGYAKKSESGENRVGDGFEDEESVVEYMSRLHVKVNRETGYWWETLEDGINFLLEV